MAAVTAAAVAHCWSAVIGVKTQGGERRLTQDLETTFCLMPRARTLKEWSTVTHRGTKRLTSMPHSLLLQTAGMTRALTLRANVSEHGRALAGVPDTLQIAWA